MGWIMLQLKGEDSMNRLNQGVKKVLWHICVYLKHNPGAVFVVLFMIALATAAGFLMDKKEQTAVHIANLAYLFLVIGTLIYMVQLYREKKNVNEE